MQCLPINNSSVNILVGKRLGITLFPNEIPKPGIDDFENICTIKVFAKMFAIFFQSISILTNAV